MNGLNNIITKINEQTELSASRIIDESKKRAEEILAAAKNEADALTKDILDKVSAEIFNSKQAETDVSVAYRKAFKTFINVRRKHLYSKTIAFVGIFRNLRGVIKHT